MKAVIITADNLEHRFVTKYLVDAMGDHLRGIVFERSTKNTSILTALKSSVHRYNAVTIIERITTKIVRKLLRSESRRSAALAEVLGPIPTHGYIPDDLPLLHVESANEYACLNWIEDIKPDYIFVYGTSIIRKPLLALPSLQALNLHTGISPFYRGSDCAFWPLYNNEPLLVGSTVHTCTPEIDGGDIYSTVSVRLSERDDPYSAFAKSVKVGAALYASVAERLLNGEVLRPKKQDYSLGKVYKFTDKTFLQEFIMEYRVRSGFLGKTIASSGGA